MYRCMMKGPFLCCISLIGLLSATWSPPADISQLGQDGREPQIAADGSGIATAVWTESVLGGEIIQSSTKPLGGSWTAPVTLSQVGSAGSPQIAVNSNGDAAAVWMRVDGTKLVVQAATKPVHGSWSTPVSLSQPGQDAAYPQVIVDSAGNVTAAWGRYDGAHTIVQASTKPSGGGWSFPVDLTQSGLDADYPQLGVDNVGNVTAVWLRSNGTNYIIQAATKPFGNSWTIPVDLSQPGQDGLMPQIAVDGNGNASAIWVRSNGTNLIIQSSSKPFGGTWTIPVDLSQPGQDAGYSQIAVDGAGNFTAVWARYNGTNEMIQSSAKPFGGDWTVPVDVSQTGQNALPPEVAVDSAGNATAVWMESSPTEAILASTKLLGGEWSAPVTLSSQNVLLPQVAVDGMGNAYAVWGQSNGTNYIVRSAWNFFGPVVNGLQPASGSQAGSTSVTITGTDFLDVTAVNFGSTPALSFTVVSPTTITAIAPPGTGTVDVTVTASSLTSTITSADQYTYVLPAPTAFTGKTKLDKKKLSVKTKWNKSTGFNVVRYEIFARNKRIEKISAKKKPHATVHLHPHKIPHRVSKDYRLYMHDKYKIRAVDSSGAASEFTRLKVQK